ncbi:MAG: hypothetical protein IJW00_10575 [Clostridia bacterium]|nr:hypothetical protein [Clostridia bacterium]
MGQKPNITTGFLFDRKWEPAIRRLKPKDFHKLFWELYDFQMSGGRTAVPVYEDNPLIGTVVSFVVPQIQNRIVASGLFSQRATVGTPDDRACSPAVRQTTDQGGGTAGGVTGGAVPPAVGGSTPCAAPKLSQDKITLSQSQVERKLNHRDGKTAIDGGLPSVTSSPKEKSEKEELYQSRKDAPLDIPPGVTPPPQERSDKKQAYGTHKNVSMTPEGYRLITECMGIPEAYINHFSEKLANHGYQYPDHAAAISAWWREEKNKLYWKHAASSPQGSPPCGEESSFDTDEFFEAAVRKALGPNA